MDYCSRVSAVELGAQRALMRLLHSEPVLCALPPRPAWLRRLLKHIIISAEEEGIELDDELVELHAHLLLNPKAGGAGGVGAGPGGQECRA